MKKKILRLAREKRSPLLKEQAIHIFGDLTDGEAAFNNARKALQYIAGARFGFGHPTTFRFTLPGGDEHRFIDPQKAMDYIKSAPSPEIPGLE